MEIKLRNAYSFRGLGCRDNQEDSRYPDADTVDVAGARCFVVCDGVGGAAKGEVASSTAARAIGTFIDSLNHDAPFTGEELMDALDAGYTALDNASDNTNRGMGTTMTLAVFHKGGVTVAHIGDSRIYHIRPTQGILYRSEDHSLVNALVRTGNITPEEAIGHPRSNVITRCMSAAVDHARDNATAVMLTDIMPGDVFLLMSDGVLHCVDDDELCSTMAMDIPDEAKRDLLRQKCAESPDNNTLWMITVGDVLPPVDNDDTAPAGLPENTDTMVLDTPVPSCDEIKPASPAKKRHSSLLDRISSLFKRH